MRLWETNSGRLAATLRGHTGAVFGVAVSADGRLVVSGGFDGVVRLWESNSGTCLRTLRSPRRFERLDISGLTGITEVQRTGTARAGSH